VIKVMNHPVLLNDTETDWLCSVHRETRHSKSILIAKCFWKAYKREIDIEGMLVLR
jgi:hypothetical protein